MFDKSHYGNVGHSLELIFVMGAIFKAPKFFICYRIYLPSLISIFSLKCFNTRDFKHIYLPIKKAIANTQCVISPTSSKQLNYH